MANSVLALITHQDELSNVFLERFREKTGLTLEVFSSISSFQIGFAGKSVAILLVDLKTLFRANEQEKRFIYETEEFFPVSKVQLQPAAKAIVGTLEGASLEGDDYFERLVTYVEKSPPRALRRSQRHPLILSLRVHTSHYGEAPLLANTLNISENGAFVITGNSPPVGSEIRLEVTEMDLPENERTLRCQVRWVLPWGKNRRHFAGFGAGFTELSETQLGALRRIPGFTIPELSPESLIREYEEKEQAPASDKFHTSTRKEK